MGPPGRGRLVSLNVGPVRTVEWHGRTVETGIWKDPVVGRRAVTETQIDGDRQADLTVHGGADKAAYAYAVEDLRWWAATHGRPFPPATLGENLTTEGIDVTNALVGERWRIGTALLEVSQPREPCFKLDIRLGQSGWVERFHAAARPGAYLRVIEKGTIGASDVIDVVERPTDGFSVVELIGVRSGEADADLLRRVAACAAATDRWREKAQRALTG